MVHRGGKAGSVNGWLRTALLVTVGSLFRLFVLLVVAAIAVLDVALLMPQSHTKGKILDALLLLACIALAVAMLIPVFAPNIRLRRSRAVSAAPAGRAKPARRTGRQFANTSWR